MSQADTHAGPPAEELDPANQSLAEALRKSFWVLKLLMMVLVILYVFSGAFTVESDEVGFKMRYGRVVGDGAAAVLPPGFHWSLPYPFEQNTTVSTNERELPVEFIYLLSETEIEKGILEIKFNNFLNPEVDDFLITGDLNIIHGKLLVKYRITDPVAYITHVFPMPTTDDPRPDRRSRFPEATILESIVRSAVIEVAAGSRALTIRGQGQERFLHAVGRRVNDKLAALARSGTPLGITVHRDTGIIGSKVADVEAIFPPRQVQAEFDRVSAAQSEKNTVIGDAEKMKQALLIYVAGTNHDPLYQALEEEYQAILALSAAERDAVAADMNTLKADVAAKREKVEGMLRAAAGMIQARISRAEGVRDTLVQEAQADHDQLMRLLPEYRRNPDIFLSRKKDEVYAQALSMDGVKTVCVPRVHPMRIHIPQLKALPGPKSPAEAFDDYARITIDQLIMEGRLDPRVMLRTSR